MWRSLPAYLDLLEGKKLHSSQIGFLRKQVLSSWSHRCSVPPKTYPSSILQVVTSSQTDFYLFLQWPWHFRNKEKFQRGPTNFTCIAITFKHIFIHTQEFCNLQKILVLENKLIENQQALMFSMRLGDNISIKGEG